MAVAKVLNQEGAEVGSVDLADEVFDVAPCPPLVHEVAVALQNSRRQGNAETRTRKEVRGGGAKPYRQKGTGRARHGSTREPQMRGGGVVFGPHKRSYRQHVPVGSKRKALCSVLSERCRTEALVVLDRLDCPEAKTKPFAALVQRLLADSRKLLLVMADVDKNVLLSTRNLKAVTVCTADDMNVLDVLHAPRVIVVQDAVAKLEKRLSAPRRDKERVA